VQIVTIVSKTAPPDEQGNLQGFISASKSFANIVTPLVMCPVTGMNPFSALQIWPEI
jgi:hypothetical protein